MRLNNTIDSSLKLARCHCEPKGRSNLKEILYSNKIAASSTAFGGGSPRNDKLNLKKLDKVLRNAIAEDLGRGDITTKLTIPKNKFITAVLLVREPCIICGLPIVEQVFKIIDKSLKFKAQVSEGQALKSGEVFAKVSGRARSILTAERVSLNFLSLLSAVATKTKQYVLKIKPFRAKIVDTRKTIPGLRELQKYAVRVGGGYNHRMDLSEMVLVKDNHIKISGGSAKFLSDCRDYKVEIEVENLVEFKHALSLKPDVIMLDNMSIKDMKAAVKIRGMVGARHAVPLLEASGGVNLNSVRNIASTGVDIISVGALTHSVKSIDMSLEIE